jgi:hydroxyacylglutathione hydrolase
MAHDLRGGSNGPDGRRLTEIAPGVLVGTSERYLTTTTVVVGADGGCLVIDPAIERSDLLLLAAELASLGLRPVAGWSTHPHWDHVLWCRELGDVPRYAAPRAAATAAARRARLVAAAEESVPGHDLDLLGRVTALESAGIPWNGPVALVLTHDGHAPGHGAVFLPGAGVLIAGDMCSDVEIPLLDETGPGALADYRAGLALLGGQTGVRWVVPGHGHVGDTAEFRRRLAEDGRYLDALEAGVGALEPGPDVLEAGVGALEHGPDALEAGVDALEHGPDVLEAGGSFEDSRLTQDWLRAEHVRQFRQVREGSG